MVPPPRVPSAEELSRLQLLCDESGRHSTVQIGAGFARRLDYAAPEAPLARLFRHGEFTLRLHLTLLMLTRKEPHELFRDTSPENFALTFGLARPDQHHGAGTRRMTRAFTTLEEEGLITRTRRRGRFPLVTVHHEADQKPPYITLPLDLWKNGWLNVLPNSALTVYVALRLEEAGKDGEKFHIRTFERELYGLSPESWRRGTKQLRAANLLKVTLATPEDRSIVRRERNIYQLLPTTISNHRPGHNP